MDAAYSGVRVSEAGQTDTPKRYIMLAVTDASGVTARLDHCSPMKNGAILCTGLVLCMTVVRTHVSV